MLFIKTNNYPFSYDVKIIHGKGKQLIGFLYNPTNSKTILCIEHPL